MKRLRPSLARRRPGSRHKESDRVAHARLIAGDGVNRDAHSAGVPDRDGAHDRPSRWVRDAVTRRRRHRTVEEVREEVRRQLEEEGS